MRTSEKTYTLHHGTVTGRDEIFLESFIVTGAASGKGCDPWDQKGGIYLCPAVGWSNIFSMDKADTETDWRGNEIKPLRVGRGMIVEIRAKIDGKNWQVDHEMSWVDSMEIIRRMRDCLPSLPLDAIYKGFRGQKKQKIRFTALRDTAEGLEIDYHFWGLGDETDKTLVLPWKRGGVYCQSQSEAFFLDKVHAMLERLEPRRYAEENLKVLTDMLDNNRDTIKYVGRQPLPVSAIYLRPLPESEAVEKYCASPPLELWEKVFERAAPAVALPRQSPRKSLAPSI